MRSTSRTIRLINVLLFVPMLALCLLLVVLVRERQSYFLGWSTGCIFYLLPSLLVLTLACAFWLPAVPRTRIALVIWAVGFALVICEASLQVFAPDWSLHGLPLRHATWKKLGRSFDARTKRQVIEDYRANGQVAVPVLPVAVLFAYSNRTLQTATGPIIPLSGISNSLSVYDNETGEYLAYVSDEFGFTNPAGAVQVENCDVLVVGDSFAHGACVPVGKDSVSLIRQRVPATINLGYMAGGPLSYLGTLTEYGLAKRPRIVLWYHFEGNDFHNLFYERQTLLCRYMEDGFQQSLASMQPEIDRVLREFVEKQSRTPDSIERSQFFLWRVATLQALRKRVLSLSRQNDLQSTARLDYFERVLSKASARVQEAGGELKMVYLPAFERYQDESTPCRQQERLVLAAMSKLGIPVINVAAAFEKNSDPLSFYPLRINGHYTEAGYALVAQAILDEILPIEDCD